MTDDGAKALAAAIVKQAAEDYRSARKYLSKHGGRTTNQQSISIMSDCCQIQKAFLRASSSIRSEEPKKCLKS